MSLSRRLFMLVFCVYSFTCVADPTIDILNWIKAKEIEKAGDGVKIDLKAPIHKLYYLGQEKNGHDCKVDFISDESDKNYKDMTITVGPVDASEEADIYTKKISARMRMGIPMIGIPFFGWDEYNANAQTDYVPLPNGGPAVKFRLATKDLYYVPSGFGFSYVDKTEDPKGKDLVPNPRALSVNMRIMVEFKRTREDGQLPDIDMVEAYELKGKHPDRPIYTCYFP